MAKIAPKKYKEKYIKNKLQFYGYIGDSSEELDSVIGYALNWAEDFKIVEKTSIKLSHIEAEAVREFISILELEDNVDKIQGAIFQTAKKYGLKPQRFFKVLYSALLGIPRGPKLGPYILDIGKKNVINTLKELLLKQLK